MTTKTRFEGIVKEKEMAFRVYDEAISTSHGAFLMEKGKY
jgi:hypothetical protein